MRGTRGMRLTAMAGVGALVLTGCLQSSDESSDSSSSGGSDSGDGVVEVFGAFTGTEQKAFEDTVAPFEEDSGIDIEYTGNTDFTTLIQSNVQSGNAPDIGIFPQPGLLLDIAADGDIVPIDDYLDTAGLEQTLVPGLLDAVTDGEGTVFGAPMKLAVKSLVWVPRDAWEQGGYKEPKTYQELLELSEQIAADGIAPWCLGMGAGSATGWYGTDWVEEMVLRTAGPEVYDQWYTHDIPFDDPQIQEAFDAYGEIVFTEGFVLGGTEGIINTSVEDADNPQFEDPPGCMMQRQGNFVVDFYPTDVQKNLDDNFVVFDLPPIEGGYDGNAVLGGGDLVSLFNGEDEEAQQVADFLTSDQFGNEWAQTGSFLSPHTSFDASQYPNETIKQIATIATSADTFRFDASDLMPGEVGAGTFWDGMVEWTSGDASTEEVTADIEESWPS
ncbi:MAG: ABC transporter substrate-binding protein [Actinomycetota bacterium]|nr:ABC transporter substrate-binding protein [Actinomycetota bacterium]